MHNFASCAATNAVFCNGVFFVASGMAGFVENVQIAQFVKMCLLALCTWCYLWENTSRSIQCLFINLNLNIFS